MKRCTLALILCFALSLKAQPPIGPIGGSAGLKGFSFQNSNGFIGNVITTGGNVTLSLQLGNQAIGLSQLTLIGSNTVLGNNTGVTGPVITLTASNVLDIVGNTRGSILYRGAGGWSILAPGANGSVLTSGGAGVDPTFTTSSGTVSTVGIGNLSPLFTASVSNPSTTPSISFALSNAAGKSWFGNATGSSASPAFNTSAVPVSMLGSGSDGSGNHALFDNGQWQTLVGGGSVSTFSAGNLSPIFTTSVATATTTPALTFSLSNAAAHSYLGNNTGSSGAPAYHVIDLSELSGTAATSQIAASAVTYAKIQNVSASVLLGNPTGSPAAPLEISLDGEFSFSSSTLRPYNSPQALGAFAIDGSTGNQFTKTLSAGANTFTWTNFPNGKTILISCQQVASGTVGTVVFPALGADGSHTTKWKGGSQPVQTATFNKIDNYVCRNQGGDVLCFGDQNY